MTPEAKIELALYRVSDQMRSELPRARFPDLQVAIAEALRAVGAEIATIEREQEYAA